MQDQTFQFILNGVPYIVKASPFEFNSETRYSVSYNGSDDYVFAFDSTVGMYTALNDDSTDIPDDVETAIAERLYALTTV